MDSTLLLRVLRIVAVAVATATCLPAAAINHDLVVAPLATGRFPVACSNVEHDLARMASIGGVPSDYWEGNTVNGSARYITEILAHPEGALLFSADTPLKPFMYPKLFGRRIDFAAIVCYPTTRANSDPDYILPADGGTVPHMQPPTQAPKIVTTGEYAQALGLPVPNVAGATQALPLIVYSHGLAGSPLGKGYLDVMVALASQGFMVSAVFHADARYSTVKIENLSDLAYALIFFPTIVEMQALRPLALKAMTDALLADNRYAAGIDTTRIGAFGASLGGEAVLHLIGARITASLSKSCDDPVMDPRIRAALGYVPYAGQSFLPAFCDGQSGAAKVNRPFLGISGTADTTAPITQAQQAINLSQSTRYLVEFVGGKHELRLEDANDVLTWMVTFYNAYLEIPGDAAMARLIRMTSVAGGADDRLIVDVHVPATAGTGPRAIEFRNAATDRYTFAVGDAEAAALDAQPDMEPARHAFRTSSATPTASATVPVCRFQRGGGIMAVFGVGDFECGVLSRTRGLVPRDTPFYMTALAGGTCPAGMLQVSRAWAPASPGRLPGLADSRLTTSDSTLGDMARMGWRVQGPVMCAPA